MSVNKATMVQAPCSCYNLWAISGCSVPATHLHGVQKITGFDSRQPDKYGMLTAWLLLKSCAWAVASNSVEIKTEYRKQISLGGINTALLRVDVPIEQQESFFRASNAQKTLWRTPKDLKKSATKRFFCSSTCAAISNNAIRSASLPKNFCRHPSCSKQIPGNQRYCSRTCSVFSRQRTPESLREEVLAQIKNFNASNGRIPTKKEMYGAYGKARDVFGTWNKAVEMAGYKANPVMFAKKAHRKRWS